MAWNALSGMGLPASSGGAPSSPVTPQPTADGQASSAPNSFDAARHVAANLDVGALSHGELANRIVGNGHAQKALLLLIQAPSLSKAHVVGHLNDAVKRGAFTPDQAAQMHATLPTDPALLRGALTHLHQVAVHAGTALKAEQGHRLWGAPPGASRSKGSIRH